MATSGMNKFKRVVAPAGSCFNCGLYGHMAGQCTNLTCGFCGKTWPSLKTIGRHTSNNCEERIATTRAATDGRGRGGRGSRGDSGRGRGGRSGGRWQGRGQGGRDSGRGRGNNVPKNVSEDNPPKKQKVNDDSTMAFAHVTAALEKIVKRLEDASV
jgi:hypothetical protein